MSKMAKKLQERIEAELRKFETTKGNNTPDVARNSALGRANDKLSHFIEKSQKK